MIRFWDLDEINIYSWYRFKATSTLEHVSLRDSSTIWSYSRTISRTRSRTRHSTWRSLVSKQNSRGGLFEAFYRSLDQRSPSFFPTVYLRHRWRCELRDPYWLQEGRIPTQHSDCSRLLTRKQIPVELQSAYPARGASIHAIVEMHALYPCGNAYEIRHSHARKWKYDLPLCST